MATREKEAAAKYVTLVSESLSGVADPRVTGRTTHQLLNIVVITLLAVMCGAEDWGEIETYGKARKDWLSEFLELPKKTPIPGHDTVRRVFSALNQKALAGALLTLTRGLYEATRGSTIAIDGKTLRGTCRKDGTGGLHLVSAWATDLNLTLSLVACEEKSNEITAIPEVLKLLELKGATVSIDAMGCQTEIASQIRAQGGHYLLGLKGNQSGLQKDMEALRDAAFETDFAHVKHTQNEKREKGHGRDVTRICIAIEIPSSHPQRKRWRDLRTLVLTLSCRHEADGTEVWEERMHITSLAPNATALAKRIRDHWSTENRQHWNLDVSFDEDAQRARDKNALANLALIKRLTLSLLRQETTLKVSIKQKRFACALDNSYVVKVLQSGTF